MLHNVERSSKYEEPRCSECILYPVCVGMFAAQLSLNGFFVSTL